MTDTELIDWVDEKAEEITIIRRQVNRTTEVTVSWSSAFTGCVVETKAPTVREAVHSAVTIDAETPDDYGEDDDDDFDHDYDDDEDDDEDEDE